MGPRRVLMDEALTLEFIEEIKQREWLWNPKDSSYNDRYYVMGTWKEIAQKFNIAEDVIKTKWKSLRDLFRREMKHRNYPDSLDSYDGKWRYFSIMWFLNSTESRGNPTNNDNDNHDSLDNEPDPLRPSAVSEPYVKSEPEEEIEFSLEEQSRKRKREEDESEYDMMFLKSLMPYFKQLDSMRKLRVRSKMQNMLLNELSEQTDGKSNDGKD